MQSYMYIRWVNGSLVALPKNQSISNTASSYSDGTLVVNFTRPIDGEYIRVDLTACRYAYFGRGGTVHSYETPANFSATIGVNLAVGSFEPAQICLKCKFHLC